MTEKPESTLDFAKSLMDLDVTKGAEQVLDTIARLPVPGVDMDALVASQRYNLEAVINANRAVMEGMKGVSEWQMKILNQTIEEISNATGGMSQVHSPQDAVVEQTELAKRAFETAVTNMRELADILKKANEAATKSIVDRVPESLDEVKEVLKVNK